MRLIKLIFLLQFLLGLNNSIFGQTISKRLVAEFTPQQWSVFPSYRARFEEDKFELMSWQAWSPSLGVNLFWDKSKWSFGIGINLFYSSDYIYVNYLDKKNHFPALERDMDGFYSMSQFISGLHFCLSKKIRRLNYGLKIGLQNTMFRRLSYTDEVSKIYLSYIVENGELQGTRRASLERSFNNDSPFCGFIEWNIFFQMNKVWGVGFSCSYRYFVHSLNKPLMTLTAYMDEDFLEQPRADIPKIFEMQFAHQRLHSGVFLTYSFFNKKRVNEQLKEVE